MKTIYHCFIFILCVFSPVFAKAQGISGPETVCGGLTAGTYQIIDLGCVTVPYNVSWQIFGGATQAPNNNSSITNINWNGQSPSAIKTGTVNATYDCKLSNNTVVQRTSTQKTVNIFILDPPILTNLDPTEIDCGSKSMFFRQDKIYNNTLFNPHPPVTTTWSVPNCWNMIVDQTDRRFMDVTTDAGAGFGIVSVKISAPSCSQSVIESKSFTRILGRTISQNPVMSDTRSGFIRVNGNSSIPNLSTVVFTSGSFIDLEPSFTSEYGSNFTAQIVQTTPCVPTLCPSGSFGKMDVTTSDLDPINNESSAVSSIIKVFPNPFVNNIQINYNQEEGSYELFDISGKVLTYGKLKLELNQIELTKLEKGIYFIRVIDKQGVQLHVSKVYKLN